MSLSLADFLPYGSIQKAPFRRREYFLSYPSILHGVCILGMSETASVNKLAACFVSP